MSPIKVDSIKAAEPLRVTREPYLSESIDTLESVGKQRQVAESQPQESLLQKILSMLPFRKEAKNTDEAIQKVQAKKPLEFTPELEPPAGTKPYHFIDDRNKIEINPRWSSEEIISFALSCLIEVCEDEAKDSQVLLLKQYTERDLLLKWKEKMREKIEKDERISSYFQKAQMFATACLVVGTAVTALLFFEVTLPAAVVTLASGTQAAGVITSAISLGGESYFQHRTKESQASKLESNYGITCLDFLMESYRENVQQAVQGAANFHEINIRLYKRQDGIIELIMQKR